MPLKSTNWFGIWVCFSAGLVAAMTMNKASPAALDIASDLQLSLFQVGWVVSMVAVATILLGVASGHLVRRYGALQVLITGVVILLFTPLLGFFASEPQLLLFDRALEGIGVILIMVAAPATIINLTIPRDIGLSMGVWALWMPCGGSLIFLLAPWLLSMGGWRILWLSTTAVAALILPLLLYLWFHLRRRHANDSPLKQSSSEAVSGKRRDAVDLSINPRGAVLLAVIFACFTADFFGIVTYLPTYLHTVNGLSRANASLLTALLPAVLIVGNLVSGVLVHRGLRPSLVMTTASILISLSLGVTVLAGEGALALILLAVFGFFTGVVPTAMFAQAPRFASAPPAVGMVIGIAVTGQGMGILLAPPLIAYLIGPEHNWIKAMPLLLVLPLIVSGLSLYLPRFEEKALVEH